MKVNSFNNVFLSNNQNKEQNLKSQNKDLMQNQMCFKGSAANDTLSVMGQAQVNINKSQNISFKGKPPTAILANLAEGRRPEQLRTLNSEFARKIAKYYPSEYRFDREVFDCIFDRSNKRLQDDGFDDIKNFAFTRSSMTNGEKFCDHVFPDKDQIEEYTKTHPCHYTEYKLIGKEKNRGLFTTLGATIATGVAVVAIPVTAGLSALLLPIAGGATTYASGVSQMLGAKEREAELIRRVAPEFQSGCLDYKLKRLIAKGKIEAGEAIEVIKHYK